MNINNLNNGGDIVGVQWLETADGEQVTTSMSIAASVRLKHASVLQLIRKNIKELSALGEVEFRRHRIEVNGEQKSGTVALLNKQHLLELASCMRNGKAARRFKKWIVKETNGREAFLPENSSVSANTDVSNWRSPSMGWAIRTMLVDGEVAFVAKDVAEALGYSDPSSTISKHCKGLPIWQHLQTDGGVQQVRMIREPDLYRLIMRSKLPDAQRFEAWVVEEILPSIRKTGGYTPEPEFDPANLSRMDILQLAIDSEKERLLLEAKIKEDAPLVAFAKQVEVIPDSMSVSQAAKILGTGRTRLYAFLRQISWVTRRNEPYQSKIEAGYLDVKISQWEHPEKGIQECITTLVTGKGLSRIHKLWNQNKDAITQCHSTGHMIN